MLDYEYYKNIFHGAASKLDFEKLFPYVGDFIQVYCDSFISLYKKKSVFSDYGFDLQKACCYQFDFIDQNGGINVFNGQSDFDVSSVSTSGYSVNSKSNVELYNGIPLSPLAKSLIRMELKQRNYLSRCIY